MIQSTSPPAARPKWLKMSGGRMRRPDSRCCRTPPRVTQMERRTNPPPAVKTQVMSAAHSMRLLPSSLGLYGRIRTSVLVPVRVLLTPDAPERVAAGDEHRHE